MKIRPPALALLVLGGLLFAATAGAQTQGTGQWEFEGHGGFTMAVLPMGGAIMLPVPGPPIPTSSPIFPTREVPSWFFGDGASLLNAVNEDFGLAARIQPLDAALGVAGIDRSGAATFGVRIRRRLAPAYAVEFSLDVLTGTGRLADEFLAAADETRASFQTAIDALLSSGPFSDPVAASSILTRDGSSRQIAFTGALVQQLGQGGSLVPYVTLGGGITRGAGAMPTIRLDGNYQFDILDLVPIAESDSVVLEFDHRTTFVGVVGGGIRRDVSDQWGLRVDGRVFIGPNPIRARISATPSVTPGTPADFVESFTTPSIQFSNDPSTGRRSSLGGPGLQDFEVFLGEGIRTRVLVTVGVFMKF